MIPAEWRQGEIAVVGLGASGRAAATLLARDGLRVYASDSGSADALAPAAAALRPLGVAVELGHHDLDRIARASLVVVSPGVPPEAPPLVRARGAGTPVVSEVEIGLRYLPPRTRIIAVTGTNGKTTTTALVGHLLRALGRAAVDAGNIGTPVTEVALAAQPPEWIALEMSSFQLHDTPGIAPAVGVVTNLSPDHLDRYARVEDYYADKALLFRNATPASRWVLNADDPEVGRLPGSGTREARGEAALREGGGRGAPGVGTSRATTPHATTPSRFPLPAAPLRGALPGSYGFSLRAASDAWYDRERDVLVVLGEPLLARGELALFGDHNVANALAAALAVMVADEAHVTPEARLALAEGLRSFRALAHRLEVAGEYGGVLWINDSKATNVSSTLVALQGMTRPTIVLLGGRHKGEPYTALADPLRRIGKAVIAYGEAGPLVERDLAGVVPVHRLGSDFGAVIAAARALAHPGDAVLLSPACSSYDMFANYVERGTTFKRLAAAGGAGEG